MDKETIKLITTTVMVYDEKHRFDSWTPEQVTEFVNHLADAIANAHEGVKSIRRARFGGEYFRFTQEQVDDSCI